MARSYYEEVRKRIEETPADMSRLLTYGEIVEQFGSRFDALGLGRDEKAIRATLRSMASRRILRRYEVVGTVKIPANDIEIYLDVMSEPRLLV